MFLFDSIQTMRYMCRERGREHVMKTLRSDKGMCEELVTTSVLSPISGMVSKSEV